MRKYKRRRNVLERLMLKELKKQKTLRLEHFKECSNTWKWEMLQRARYATKILLGEVKR